MIRKMLAASVAILAMFFGVLSLNAGANTQPDNTNTCGYYLGTSAVDCNAAVAYTGPFTNHPAAPTGPYGWGSLNVVASAPAAGGTGGGNAAAALAHTGSESTAIAYVGTGMIAFGAVALGSRRKFFQGALV